MLCSFASAPLSGAMGALTPASFPGFWRPESSFESLVVLSKGGEPEAADLAVAVVSALVLHGACVLFSDLIALSAGAFASSAGNNAARALAPVDATLDGTGRLLRRDSSSDLGSKISHTLRRAATVSSTILVSFCVLRTHLDNPCTAPNSTISSRCLRAPDPQTLITNHAASVLSSVVVLGLSSRDTIDSNSPTDFKASIASSPSHAMLDKTSAAHVERSGFVLCMSCFRGGIGLGLHLLTSRTELYTTSWMQSTASFLIFAQECENWLVRRGMTSISSSLGIPQCLHTCSFANDRMPLSASSMISGWSRHFSETFNIRMSSTLSPLIFKVFFTISLVLLSSLSVMLIKFVINRIASAHSIQSFFPLGSPSCRRRPRICFNALLDRSWSWKSTARFERAKIAFRAMSPSSSHTNSTNLDTHPAFITDVLHLYVMDAMECTALAASFLSLLRRCFATSGMSPAAATSLTGAFAVESMLSSSAMCFRRSRGALALSIRDINFTLRSMQGTGVSKAMLQCSARTGVLPVIEILAILHGTRFGRVSRAKRSLKPGSLRWRGVIVRVGRDRFFGRENLEKR